MTTPRLLVLFAATFAVGLLAFAPLSLLAGGRLAAAGLTASSVQGSIWGGTLRGAAWQGRDLGGKERCIVDSQPILAAPYLVYPTGRIHDLRLRHFDVIPRTVLILQPRLLSLSGSGLG